MRTGRTVERNREMEKGSSVRRGARPERVGQQLLDIGTLLWPLLLTIPDGVCRERATKSERATAAEGIGLGKGASHGAPRRRRGCSRSTRSAQLSSARLYSPERRSETRLGSGTQAHRWLAGWLAGLAWRTESPPGHPPRPFTGTEPHPIPVALIHPRTDSRLRP